MIVNWSGNWLKGLAGDNESDEKTLGPCPRCSGKGTIAVDSGTTLSGPAELESRNKTVACPDCHGLGFSMQRLGPKADIQSLLALAAGSKGQETNAPPLSQGNQATMALDLGKGIRLELIEIPEGKFVMGSPANEMYRYTDEGLQHEVTISQRFYMGKLVVTRDQYDQVMGSKSHGGYYPAGKSAAERVSWDDAQEFCKKSSIICGQTVQLPTEAQWEYACRAGSTTAFCFGDSETDLGDYAWYSRNSNYFQNPVGEKKPNAWGLYDMHGNMLEWCQDANVGRRPDFTDKDGYVLPKRSGDWEGDYLGGPVTDPVASAKGVYHVLRGGCSIFDASACRSASRYYAEPISREAIYGFRVIVST